MTEAKAELILKNGRIWRGAGLGVTEALAAADGVIMATGADDEVGALAGPDTVTIDLRGRLAIPGFYDAHMHLLPLGLTLGEIDARPAAAPTMDALIDRVRRHVADLAPGAWAFGRGYDHHLIAERRHPTRDDLDAAAPDNPVYIKRTCGHMGVANSAALALAGVDQGSAQPPGGHIERRDGRPTGLLQERAQQCIFDVMPPPSSDALTAAVEDASRLMLAQGITSAMDAGVGMRAGFAEYRAYARARDEGRLPMRAYLCLVGGPNGIVEEAYAEGLVTGVGDEWLKVGPIKIFTDGSAGGRTAAMREAYVGDDCDCGMFLFGDDDMNDMAMDYHVKGYQLGVHAIGDAAIDQTLAAVGRAMAAHPVVDRRHRIEHCGFIHPEQIAEMVRLGMVPVPQPIFIHQFGDAYVEVLGEERPASAYPMASWIAAGLKPAASTDAPVSDYNPFLNGYATLTRAAASGRVIGADQCIGIEAALTAMTYNGAYAGFSETTRGTIETGKLADIAVIDTDLLRANPDEIRAAQADLTVLGGDVVHDRLGEASS